MSDNYTIDERVSEPPKSRFKKGDRVRLSAKSKSRGYNIYNHADPDRTRIGTIKGVPRSESETVSVWWDGLKQATSIHHSFIELANV